jgi:predicted ATPase
LVRPATCQPGQYEPPGAAASGRDDHGITRGKALPSEIANQIIDRTDGVPLFVEELTKAVVESGMLSDAGDHYVAAGPVTPLAIRASLQASLVARLDRLAPVREVAQIGAALGGSSRTS